MSEEEKDIVTEPLPKKRVKDPKKVAAGLKLAQKNKEAREALEREKAREASAREVSESADSDSSEDKLKLSSLSWQHFIGLGGLIIGAAGLYLQWRKTPPTPVTNIPSRIEKNDTPPMV